MSGPIHVLVVDDEINIRLTLRTALELDGHTVTEAANGREMVERLARETFGLVLLDLSMPVMDGMSALRALHKRSEEGGDVPPVIVLTAYGSIPLAVEAMRLGASDFVEKPFTREDLREAMDAVLAEAPAADAGGALPTYAELLGEVRQAMRIGRFDTAEALLMKAGTIASDDAAFLNLVGVLHEVAGRTASAKRFYRQAVRAAHGYPPAIQNIRRLYELTEFGHTDVEVALGDGTLTAGGSTVTLLQRIRRLLANK